MFYQRVLLAARSVLLAAPHRLSCTQHYRSALLQSCRGSALKPSTFNVCRSNKDSVTLLSSHTLTLSKPFTSGAVVKDVLLFEHDRSRFFRLLALFCAGQFLFWVYLAYVAFTGLRDTSKSSRGAQKVRAELGLFSLDMNLGSNAWRFGFTLSCLLIGGGIVGLGVLFSRRSVSRVVLHKGGGKVTVCTQSPLGVTKAQHLTVPLSQVACHAHRQESPSFIPLKVKNHKFYFLLDKEGTLNNPKLFDVTVGAYRSL